MTIMCPIVGKKIEYRCSKLNYTVNLKTLTSKCISWNQYHIDNQTFEWGCTTLRLYLYVMLESLDVSYIYCSPNISEYLMLDSEPDLFRYWNWSIFGKSHVCNVLKYSYICVCLLCLHHTLNVIVLYWFGSI